MKKLTIEKTYKVNGGECNKNVAKGVVKGAAGLIRGVVSFNPVKAGMETFSGARNGYCD